IDPSLACPRGRSHRRSSVTGPDPRALLAPRPRPRLRRDNPINPGGLGVGLALLALLVSFGAVAQEDPVHQVARAYLAALVCVGDDGARESLLGGVTMNASIATIGSWRIIAEDPVRKETGALQTAAQLMADLDKTGRATLANLLNQTGATSSNDVEI